MTHSLTLATLPANKDPFELIVCAACSADPMEAEEPTKESQAVDRALPNETDPCEDNNPPILTIPEQEDPELMICEELDKEFPM